MPKQNRRTEPTCEVNGYRLAKVREEDVIAILNEDKGPVVVSFNTFTARDGTVYRSVHIRHFWQPEDSAYFVPTKKGAWVPVEELTDLAEALMGAAAAVAGEHESPHDGYP